MKNRNKICTYCFLAQNHSIMWVNDSAWILRSQHSHLSSEEVQKHICYVLASSVVWNGEGAGAVHILLLRWRRQHHVRDGKETQPNDKDKEIQEHEPLEEDEVGQDSIAKLACGGSNKNEDFGQFSSERHVILQAGGILRKTLPEVLGSSGSPFKTEGKLFSIQTYQGQEITYLHFLLLFENFQTFIMCVDVQNPCREVRILKNWAGQQHIRAHALIGLGTAKKSPTTIPCQYVFLTGRLLPILETVTVKTWHSWFTFHLFEVSFPKLQVMKSSRNARWCMRATLEHESSKSVEWDFIKLLQHCVKISHS